MSSLLRPVGHLAPSVYWFRRGLLLAVVVLVLVLFGRLLGGGGGNDQQNTAANGPQPGETPPAAAGTPTPGATPAPGATPTPVAQTPGRPSSTPSGRPGTPAPSSSPARSTPTTPAPPQTCTGRDVRVTLQPSVRSIRSGGGLNFAVRLDGLRAECRAAIDPAALSVTITSGADQIWTTGQCTQSVPRSTILLAKGKQSTTVVAWNGRRSAPGCLPGQPVARPGTYVVKATYDDQASAGQAFGVS